MNISDPATRYALNAPPAFKGEAVSQAVQIKVFKKAMDQQEMAALQLIDQLDGRGKALHTVA